MMLVQISLLVLHLHLGLSISGDVEMAGDVVLGGLLAVQHYEKGSCIGLDYRSVQINEAVRWFFRQLNDRNYIPNVTLGFHAFKTCGNTQTASKQTLDMMTKYMDRHGQLLGILGPVHSSETQSVSRLLSSLPEEDRLLQISFSATAAILSDKSIYKNLYRVIETDDVQVEVTLKLMQALKWNYVSIVFDSDTYGRDAAYALRASAEAEDICIPVFLPLDLDQTKTEQQNTFSELIQRLWKDEESPVLGLVFFGRAETAKDMFMYLDSHLELTHFQMIVSESLAVDKVYVEDTADGQIIPRAKGLITPSPPYYNVEGFSQFWADLHNNITLITRHVRNNDWLGGYLQKITGCQFKDNMVNATSCLSRAGEYIRVHEKLHLYTHYALRGAAAFAKTIKQLHTECDSNTNGCDQMRRSRAISKMKQIDVSTREDFNEEFSNLNDTFSFEKGEIRHTNKEEPDYTVYNFKRSGGSFGFYKVRDFRDGRLHKIDTIEAFDKDQENTSAVQAQCQPSYDCGMCVTSEEDVKVLHTPGDFYVIGMAPIHSKEDNFLKCGNIRDRSLSVDLTTAMQFAISTLNNKTGTFRGILGNKTIGLVALDTCSNPYKIQEQIISLNDGSLRLDHKSNSSKILGKIIGYIGPALSFVTVPLSTLLTQTKALQISYSATATTLSNREHHPYFMRISSPDHKQAEVIMQLAKKTSSKYIQIIFSKEEYGIAGKESLMDAAKKQKICVAQTIEAENSNDPSKHTGYISKLRQYRYAKVVVVFALPSLTRQIMQNLDKDLESREFSFIGGESWAQMEELLTTKLLGSITIAQKLPEIIPFLEYLRNIDIETHENPWLQEYFEEKQQCYISKSFRKNHRSRCPSSRLGDTMKPDFWATFGVYTVYSLVLGFHDAATSICKDLVICPDISTPAMIDKLKQVKLDMYQNGNSIRVFDSNGDGNVGYTISQIVRKQSLCMKSTQPNSSGTIIFYSLVSGASVLGLVVLVMSGCLCRQCRSRKTKKKDDPYSTICPRDSFIQ